jgi:outer membrane lipoprotein-sorting protein
MLQLVLLPLVLTGLPASSPADEVDNPEPRELIRAAMEHWRGITSYSEMTMVIHRSDWERSFSMQAWTEGDKLSLVRVTEPKRDAGNGTLVKDQSMWTFSPRINRILKVPSSMMNQSWQQVD